MTFGSRDDCAMLDFAIVSLCFPNTPERSHPCCNISYRRFTSHVLKSGNAILHAAMLHSVGFLFSRMRLRDHPNVCVVTPVLCTQMSKPQRKRRQNHETQPPWYAYTQKDFPMLLPRERHTTLKNPVTYPILTKPRGPGTYPPEGPGFCPGDPRGQVLPQHYPRSFLTVFEEGPPWI